MLNHAQQQEAQGLMAAADRLDLIPGATAECLPLAVRAEHEAKARFVIAIQRPRDVAEWQSVIQSTCANPQFASKARYERPAGKETATGLSIHFAEEAFRLWGNCGCEELCLTDTDDRQVWLVQATDYETNVIKSTSVVILKVMERRYAQKGQEVLNERVGSRGQKVYVVRAHGDQFTQVLRAILSKTRRNVQLSLLPKEMLLQAEGTIVQTMQTHAAKAPSDIRDRLINAFARLLIKPAQLEEYLGHPLEQASAAELEHLNRIWVAVHEGECRWDDVVPPKTGGTHNSKKSPGDPMSAQVAERMDRDSAMPIPDSPVEPPPPPEPQQAAAPEPTQPAAPMPIEPAPVPTPAPALPATPPPVPEPPTQAFTAPAPVPPPSPAGEVQPPAVAQGAQPTQDPNARPACFSNPAIYNRKRKASLCHQCMAADLCARETQRAKRQQTRQQPPAPPMPPPATAPAPAENPPAAPEAPVLMQPPEASGAVGSPLVTNATMQKMVEAARALDPDFECKIQETFSNLFPGDERRPVEFSEAQGLRVLGRLRNLQAELALECRKDVSLCSEPQRRKLFAAANKLWPKAARDNLHTLYHQRFGTPCESTTKLTNLEAHVLLDILEGREQPPAAKQAPAPAPAPAAPPPPPMPAPGPTAPPMPTGQPTWEDQLRSELAATVTQEDLHALWSKYITHVTSSPEEARVRIEQMFSERYQGLAG